ncbi:MAG: RNA polymerase sigma factor, partial [Planctomycetes bacterium]|nr:RNA polymerase sigma factor [Planctomycetota bacterium]
MVKQAQQGNEESRNRLAEISRDRLRMYVYRLTLDADLTEDILQESMLEMFKFLDKLERTEGFWSWVLRIATNNVKDHYKREQRRRASHPDRTGIRPRDRQEGLENLVSEEIKQVVSAAMRALKPRYRTVLALRCYEEMPFSKISEVMGCGQFGGRMLFARAKRALAKQLSRRGLTRGSVLMVLIVFGKMTATSEAAAANISVTAATLKVGAIASLAAVATSKTAIVTMTAAGLIAAGSVALGPSVVEFYSGQTRPDGNSSLTVQGQRAQRTGAEESWYFYPAGSMGPVMMRLAKSNGRREDSRFRILQNQHGNYRRDKNTIYIDNSRSYNADLSVRRLPTDDTDLSTFISQVESRPGNMEYVSASGRGLLVVCKRDSSRDDRIWRVHRHSNVLDELFFQFDWPDGTKIVDNRDAMHKRGWTYFRITGRINTEKITGAGRIPFVYAARGEYWPWLRLHVGAKEFVDAGDGALFKGLSRPWVGLHTIDTVRRDAAEQDVWFETTYTPGKGKAEVVLTCD